MMSGEFVVVSVGELVDELFEPGCTFKVDELTAFDTDEVVMMRPEGLSELVALFEADLDNLNYP